MEARVNPSLARELADILSGSSARQELASEGPLLVAARMLSRAADHEMTATTVVGVLGRDDVDAFRALVHNIAQEFGLEATVKLKEGSFSVRFYPAGN
jgi:poly(3-hydroxybutyrate) depolymerase